MYSRAVFLTFLFLIISTVDAKDDYKKANVKFFTALEDKLELKLGEYVNVLTGWLAKFNDEHIGNSELGKYFHYDDIKPELQDTGKQSRGMKKLSLALIPLIFHVGATSTWMLLSTLLAAKSVAIGMALLVFKIAVSSAKVASFFTLLKAKHHHEWAPHYEHHGHKRSLSEFEHHPPPTYLEPEHHDHSSHEDHASYHPDWVPSEKSYKSVDPYTAYGAESKKVEKVYGKN